MTFKRFMSLLAMALLWTGSQIPVYLFGEKDIHPLPPPSNCVPKGAIPPYIYGDIGGVDRWVWFVSFQVFSIDGPSSYLSYRSWATCSH